MALRRVLGSSSKYIQNYGRLIGSHGRSVSTPTPTNTKKQEFDYHMDLGGLGPARFATQEFNSLKNAQLQISRVLKATCRHMRKELWRSPGYYYQRYYELVLEAVDADETTFLMNDASNSGGPDLFVYLCSVFAVSRLLYMSTVTEANEVKMRVCVSTARSKAAWRSSSWL